MKTPLDLFHDLIARSIDAKGVYPHQCLYTHDGGKLVLSALDFKAEQVYRYLLTVMLEKKPEEIVFGLDRFCKEGQGTTLGDCITGAHWNAKSAGTPLWRPFVIEYQHEPRIVKPMDFENRFWNSRIISDLEFFKLECP